MLGSAFVRNREFLAAFFPAACQYPAAIGCCHALAEAVLVLSFSARRLKCAFHVLIVDFLLTHGMALAIS